MQVVNEFLGGRQEPAKVYEGQTVQEKHDMKHADGSAMFIEEDNLCMVEEQSSLLLSNLLKGGVRPRAVTLQR
jgi:hypothetical protein